MDGTPASGQPLPAVPLAPAQARRIATAFLPSRPWGNRSTYYYARAKLGSDPLYDGVLRSLPATTLPLLDLGCGLGLLGHVMRQRGCMKPYAGVDVDAGKIATATRAARQAGLQQVRFDHADLQCALPPHAGDVALLDVLQYLDASAQSTLLRAAAERVAPGGTLVLRTPLALGDRRDHATRMADRLAWLSGWMGTRPRHYPGRSVLQSVLARSGLHLQTVQPLHGRTPFNSWLLVAVRPPR